jgi:hypothetical protein
MSILNEIRGRQSQAQVAKRTDIFQEEVADDNSSDGGDSQSQVSQLDVLRKLLATYPTISNQQPIRLQVDIKAQIDALCRQEKVTAETLLEALFVAARDGDSLPGVVAQAQERLKVRKEMGNIKSRITQLGKLLKLES